MNKLQSMTNKQLDRIYRRVWNKMTEGYGYQPFGFDSHTMWAVHPEWMNLISVLRNEAKRRMAK